MCCLPAPEPDEDDYKCKCADNPDGCAGICKVEVIETNSKGGQNSKIEGRYDLVPPMALTEVAKVLEEGANKYDEWNWLNVDIEDHVNHALKHTFNFLTCNIKLETNLASESDIEELAHAATRLLMALELLTRKR